eukprot:gene5067-34862_t
MSLLAMPMVIINMGSEMLYILDQRLKAQNIPPEKGCKVLHDVVNTMFDKSYVEKLFSPQDLYSVSSTRKIFDRLAHSSIMRLSESSMDKLFDLILMGMKYQLLCSTKMEGIVEVTKLHLSTIKSMMGPSKEAAAPLELINNVEALLKSSYANMGMGQLHALRQTLQRFMQDRRVKVSLFLQEGIQGSTGRLILPSPASKVTGTVTYYDMKGGLETQEKVKLKCLEIDPMEFFVHPAPLGSNLYSKERPKVVPPPRKGDHLTAPLNKEDDPLAGEGGKQASTGGTYAQGGRHTRKELDLLSAIVAIKGVSQTDGFKLDLFQNEDAGFGKNEEYKKTGLAGVMKDMDLKDNDDDDDLLALMDGS